MNEQERPKATFVGLRELTLDGWFNSETGELTKGVRIRSTDVVIDVGCGDAGISAFCARQGAEVILIDSDQEKLSGAEERIRQTPARACRAIVSDCDPIPLPDGVGDVMICTEVLEHVPDPRKFLDEVIRIAKPGAQLVLSVPDSRSERLVGATAPDFYFRVPWHIRVFSPQEFRDLLTGSGLEIESQQMMGGFWSMYLALSWLTSGTEPTVPLDNPHPITDHWARLWWDLQRHPRGTLVRDALNDLIPRTYSIVARKPK